MKTDILAEDVAVLATGLETGTGGRADLDPDLVLAEEDRGRETEKGTGNVRGKRKRKEKKTEKEENVDYLQSRKII